MWHLDDYTLLCLCMTTVDGAVNIFCGGGSNSDEMKLLDSNYYNLTSSSDLFIARFSLSGKYADTVNLSFILSVCCVIYTNLFQLDSDESLFNID